IEIGVRTPGEAVVADDTVGDEVARAGGDVEHRHLDTEVMHRGHAESGPGVDRGVRRLPGARAVPGDGGYRPGGAEAGQLVRRGQMRSADAARRSGDLFPAVRGEESVVGAGDEGGAV